MATKKTILIVEDDGIIAIDLRETLQRLGYAVPAPVSTGRKAISAAKKHSPDLVLMDIELPGRMNGIEAAVALRDRLGIPVVFLTAYSQEALVHQAKTSEPYAYLLKPVSERELAAAIEIALYRSVVDRKLKESEERYRTLVENASEAIVVAQNHSLVYVNPRTEELLEYTRDEILSRSFTDFIHPEDRDMVADRYARRLRGEDVPARYEFRVLQKGGEIRWAQINAVPILWEGKPATLNILNDTTERKRSELKLKESDERFQNIFNQAVEGIYQSTPEGRYLRVNPAFARILGYDSPEDLIGSVTDIGSQLYADPEKRRELARLLMENDQVADFEARAFRRDGSPIWVSIYAGVVRGGDGAIMFYQGSMVDITDRKLAQEALRENEARLSAIMNTATSPIFYKDASGRYLDCNPSFEKYIGLPKEDIIGRTVFDMTPPELAAIYHQADRELLASKGSQVYEAKVRFADQSFRDVIFSKSAVIDGTGTVQGIVGILTDITTHKQAEQALSESEERYRSIVENAPLGVFRSTKEGRFISVNPSLVRMLGYDSGEELISTVNRSSISEQIYADPGKRPTLVEEASTQGGWHKYENRYRRKDGSVIVANLFFRALPHADKNGAELEGFVEDITERRLADNAIKDSEEKFSKIFRNSSNAICFSRYDDGMIMDVNDAWTRLIGIGRTEALGKTGGDIGIWRDPSDRETSLALLGEHGSVSELEVVLNTGSGPRTFLMGAEVIELKDEKYILWELHDITDRKKARQALETSEEHLRSLFDNMTEGVALHELMVDDAGRPADYRIMEVNSSYEKILGLGRDDIQGKPATEAYHVPQAPHLDSYAAVALNGGQRQFETYYEPFGKHFSISVVPWGENGFATIFTDITDRKKAEQKLLDSEKKFSGMFRLSPEMITISRIDDGTILDVNDAYERKLGFSKEESIGCTSLELGLWNDPKDREELIQAFLDRKGWVNQFESTLRRKDGSTFPVLISGAPIEIKNERLLMLIATDISERKRIEDEMRRSEERYRTLVETQTEFISRFKADGTFVFVNDVFKRYFGKTEEELIGHKWKPIPHPDDLPMVQSKLSEMSPANPIVVVENRVISKAGDINWVQFVNQGLYGQDGNLVEVLSVGRDISEQKRVEEALKETEEKFRLAFHTSPDAININRLEDGMYVEINDGFTTLTGYTRDDVMGKTSRDIEIWNDPEDRKELVHGLRTRGYCENLEAEFRRKNGSVTTALMSARIIKLQGVAHIISITRDISDRKQAEENLIQKTQELARFFDVTLDLLCIADSRAMFHRLNKAWERTLGYTLEELMSRSFFDFIHPDDLESTSEAMADLASQREVIDFINRYRCRDGSYRWIEWRAVPAGELIYAAAHDITESKRAEEELRVSLAKYRVLFNSFPLGITITDKKGVILEGNREAEKLLGLSTSEQLTRTINGPDWRIIRPDGTPMPADEFASTRALQENRLVENVEMGIDRGKGDIRWINVTAAPIPLEEFGVAITYGDVTARIKAEEELRTLASAIEQAAETVVITDPDGLIQYVNPAFERITGYAKEEAQGQNPRILNSGMQDNDFYRAMWETITQGGTWSGRMVNRRKDGTSYHEEATISPIKDKDGKVVNYVAVKKDITKEIELESQLLQSQKMEAVGQLAGGVAHDLNNLLTPILGYSEMLLEQLHTGDPRHKDISLIQKAAESAKTLTRQLLAFSRKQVLEMKPVDLGKVLSDFRKILRRTIREDIDIRIRPDAPDVSVRADIGQIEQILMNLSVNAQDAMPGGGVLTIGTEGVVLDEAYQAAHPDALPGRYGLLEVSDTGSGMDAEVLKHIFEPFYTTKGVGKGTGLGLSTVYGIVKQHAGFIDCSSEPGKGTTFRIYLPWTAEERGEQREAAPLASGKTEGSETILVVEDNALVRDLACHILRRHGYMVISAQDGKECLEIMADFDDHIDLLLTDVIMPDINGTELYQRLSQTMPGLPVIYMSGYTDDALDQHGILGKDTILIHKPFTLKSLTEKVREVLDRKPAA